MSRLKDPLKSPEAALAVREQIRATGLRLTPQRIGVIEILRNARGKHLSADDVWRRLQDSAAGMDRSTTYRVLNDLHNAGLVQEAQLGDGVTRFEIQETAHHHAVCTRCGATEDVSAEPIQQLAKALRKQSGFKVGPQPLLIAGLCAHCAST